MKANSQSTTYGYVLGEVNKSLLHVISTQLVHTEKSRNKKYGARVGHFQDKRNGNEDHTDETSWRTRLRQAMLNARELKYMRGFGTHNERD